MGLSKENIFLNNAAISPKPLNSLRAIESQRRSIATYGLAGSNIFTALKNIEFIRSELANYIGAEQSEVALMRSTTDCFVTIASGLDYDKYSGKEIILPEIEFVANSYVWQGLARKLKSQIKLVKTIDNRIQIEDIESFISDNTGLICISSVQFSTGYRINLRQISNLIHEVGGLIVVDGIQEVGALQVDVKKSDVDFYCAGGYKWLNSPLGTGFMYVNSNSLEELDPLNYNWNADAEFGKFSYKNFVKKPNASRFDQHPVPDPVLFGMTEVLRTRQSWDMQKIEKYIVSMTDYLVDELTARFDDIIILSPREFKDEKSGIVTLDTRKNQTIVDGLNKINIVVSLTEGRIRISPHIYNSIDEIDSLLSELKQFL